MEGVGRCPTPWQGWQGQNDAVESSGYALTYSGLPVARLSRVLFSVAVEGLALRACTLRSPGRKAPLSCTPGTSATCQSMSEQKIKERRRQPLSYSSYRSYRVV